MLAGDKYEGVWGGGPTNLYLTLNVDSRKLHGILNSKRVRPMVNMHYKVLLCNFLEEDKSLCLN